ncbi:hypothetical protein [Microbacterium elymi]|uniref:EamA domain-containing protein n=1 Tax=Microbacterium elymi TaxID=2909587 RepID=A0ABY5NKQ7_9MICO|nr:hypothetical protein [Microbacterium elymi]UUT35699.1 hypothetical protein L2X98_20910 [Microbacterium elymi]
MSVPIGASGVLDVAGAALWCAAFVLFAIGRDSVVARRMLGMIMLIGLGVWPLRCAASCP